MTVFDNFEILWNVLPIFPIFEKFVTVFWQFTILQFWHFSQFCQYWPILTMDKDQYKENPWDLRHLRHWLQFWQLRTWIMTIFVTWQSIVTLDSIRNSCDVLCEVFPNIYPSPSIRPFVNFNCIGHFDVASCLSLRELDVKHLTKARVSVSQQKLMWPTTRSLAARKRNTSFVFTQNLLRTQLLLFALQS